MAGPGRLTSGVPGGGRPLASRVPPRQRVALVLVPALVYLLAVLAVVFWPSPVDRPISGGLHRLLDMLHGRGVPTWFDYGAVEWLANVAMFLPWGAFGAVLLTPRRWWLVPAAALLASTAIEMAQYLLLDQRYASAADVAANTLGAVLGVLFCAATFPLVISCVRRHHTR
ncbi:VanZ family protein [Arthrobacter sp. JSM 101049]|uniref:VanZ family protein n=1 Tax=Arthrobacter sp. JSM 101049 TaxID=929097 RepID=UPI00356353EE